MFHYLVAAKWDTSSSSTEYRWCMGGRCTYTGDSGCQVSFPPFTLAGCVINHSYAASVTSWQDGQVSHERNTGSRRVVLRSCTDDVFKSTRHRAVNRSGVERHSIPLFFGTDYNVLLEVCRILHLRVHTCLNPL